MKVKFYINHMAGVAGDPSKLLIGKNERIREDILINSNSLLSIRWNKRKLKKRIEKLTGAKVEEI